MSVAAATAAVCTAAAPAAVAAAHGGWVIQPTPSPRHAFGTNLNGVSCSSARACTAVGDYFTTKAGDSATMALRWDGTRWAIQPTPSPPSQDALTGVSCPTARACTAVGEHVIDSAGDQRILIERWNGSTWTIQRAPNPPGGINTYLASVSCPSARACIAVGGFVHGTGQISPLAERWNGARWSLQRTAALPGGGAFNGVSCRSAAACTAVGTVSAGATLAERWNGTRWSVQPAAGLPGGSTSSLDSVSCPSVHACTAVGSFAVGTGPQQTLAERWNGTRWTLEPVPLPAGMHGSDRAAVSCSSVRHCTLAGDVTDGLGRPLGTLTEGWNGAGWSVQPGPSAPGIRAGFTGVSCTGPAACLAVGSYVNALVHGVVTAFAERRG